ncbi:Uncharacterised protein [Salmonella enterica subsp. enterica]|nr:Uncharacterised protein [Salmonella enterica subsp. enterica]
MIRQPDQIIQRQSLGEFAELITFFRADQRIEIAPVFHLAERLASFPPSARVGAADYLHPV